MRRFASAIVMALAICPCASAQPAPRIGPFVIDLHATVPLFPNNSKPLADSRDIDVTELPGHGLGVDGGAQIYLLRFRAVTFGIGGNLMTGRSHSTPPTPAANQARVGRAVTERFTSIAPQISLNFGNGYGWSYLSGGIGRATWFLVPDGATATAADEEKIKTINYGGGARWFKKKHVGFSFDIRFYAINPGTPVGTHPVGSPRTTLLVIGAGVSVR
jgi:hypothetical protein